ncbi:hypothetical protein SDC9_200274 [bioreactor metagenome]|uniref:Uncharacterized protein n=1 Tax=bioreactor metagenome TaxID=1076179 RepID=A0A645IP26_9ZZZZ
MPCQSPFDGVFDQFIIDGSCLDGLVICNIEIPLTIEVIPTITEEQLGEQRHCGRALFCRKGDAGSSFLEVLGNCNQFISIFRYCNSFLLEDFTVIGNDHRLGICWQSVCLTVENTTIEQTLGIDGSVNPGLFDIPIDRKQVSCIGILLHPLAVNPNHVIIS